MLKRLGTRLKRRVINTLRSPTMQCLGLGALLLPLLYQPELPLLSISAEQQRERIQGLQAGLGQQASSAELAQLREQMMDEAILLDMAQQRRFEQLPVVKGRLLQLADFLKLTPPPQTDAERDEAYHQALVFGLDQSDPVVRRYLIAAVRQSLSDEILAASHRSEFKAEFSAAIDEAAIQARYQEQNERFRQAQRWQISHVYFGGLDEASKQRAHAGMPHANADAASNIARGDAFHHGHVLPPLSQRQLAHKFGSAFAAEIPTLSAKKWHGPIASSYGYHWLRIDAESPGALKPLAEVGPLIYRELRAELLEQKLRERLDSLREDYRWMIEPMDAPREQQAATAVAKQSSS